MQKVLDNEDEYKIARVEFIKKFVNIRMGTHLKDALKKLRNY